MGRPMKPASDKPIKPKKYNKNGCISCKKRKRKCENEAWPCKLCARLGLECSGLNQLSNLPTKNDLLLQQIDQCMQLKENEKLYLKYFVNEVAPILFAKSHVHVFLDKVFSLALVYEQIRDPIIGIAATHRSCLLAQDIPPTRVLSPALRDSNIYRSRAKLTEYGPTSEDVELISVLLLVMMEILVGDNLDWFSLLKKANRILERSGGIKAVTSDTEDELKLINIQLFCYLDFVSSLSTCNPPYLELQQLDRLEMEGVSPESLGEFNIVGLVESDDIDLDKIMKSHFLASSFGDRDTSAILKIELGFKFGIAGDIFKIMGNISTLASLRKLRQQDPKYEYQFNKFASDIEMELQNWDVPQEINFENISDFQRTQYALALQWACFLRLHQIRYGYNRDDSRPKSCLINILQAIESIPERSQLEGGLLVPLILAGSVATLEKDRKFIRRRMNNISRTLRFPYVQRFEQLLVSIWDRDELDGSFVNWAAVRYYEFPGLVMF
ncbi:hypothetical protein OGAPHI_000560 [Ogataea philodendri]|uniref:Zn(2)-C6 fungal-type domain-containing protein n=1 Tax=Ogataea philodendri TaxID=1378263 RepID=A0A9P8PHF8_9ASCO|nr:uncharacterized protein OGAPHI_000560 [Ogataea philodendri]KAH3671337.1 hypothetical protein OGAPHI_000560 [Ogataea philodendri]